MVMNKVIEFIKSQWMWLLVAIGAIALLLWKPKVKRKYKRKRKAKTSAVRTRAPKNIPSRIKTKSGKVISGRENVKAYYKRLANLRKARRAAKR
jgi:hypothetical protein